MPPRYAYWTIIAGGLPTAFRTTEREELLPTFRRIKQKHPDAEMKYFARGRLWNSPGEARAESERLRAEADARRSIRAPSRGRAWRPGGDHQDPRQKFKDAKKVRNQDRRQERFDRRHKADAPPSDGGPPVRRASQSTRAPRDDRDQHALRGKPPTARDRPWNDRGPRTPKPPASGDRPWSNRPPRDRAPRDDRDQHALRGKPGGGSDSRPGRARPGPRSGSKPGGSHGSPKGNWTHKPESKSRTSGPGGRPSGTPGRNGNQRGPTKDRRRR